MKPAIPWHVGFPRESQADEMEPAGEDMEDDMGVCGGSGFVI